MGSAALFFEIGPPEATLSDINSDLVSTFCAVRDHTHAVYERMISLPQGKDSYYHIRQEDDSQLTVIDRAARAVIKDLPPIDADLNDLEKLILAKTVFIRCRGLFAEPASRRAFCV
jgi:D12 class N6 adenine-specific DNA methyltransferase